MSKKRIVLTCVLAFVLVLFLSVFIIIAFGKIDLTVIKNTFLTGYLENQDVRLVVTNPHPGIPGYDAEYEIRTECIKEDARQIKDSQIYLTCNYKDVKIQDNKIIVPSSLKDKKDISDLVITARYKDNDRLAGYCSLPIVKWKNTFKDDFNSEVIDRTKWSDHNGIWHSYFDLRNGTTVDGRYQNNGSKNIRIDEYCYIEDGHLVMPIVKNTENKSFVLNGRTFTPDYISSEVRTDNTFSQNMGCFTVKMKGPASNTVYAGSNNAFWLMPKGASWGNILFFDYNDGTYSGYGCGEIDIVERSAKWDGRWFNTYHNFDVVTKKYIGSGHEACLYNEELLTGDYVEYTIAWMKDSIYTYANGKLVRAERNITSRDSKAYMILSNNLRSLNPLDSQWTGSATDADLKDLTVYVDYVKVFAIE